MRAAERGLASEAGKAEAAGHMVGCPAVGVLATHVGKAANIHAFVSHTCLVSQAVRVDGAFRLAFNIRVALQAGQTGAGGSALSVVTHRIDAAWRWSAWVNGARCGGYKKGPVRICMRSFPQLQTIIQSGRNDSL